MNNICITVSILSYPYFDLCYSIPPYIPFDRCALGSRVCVPLGTRKRAVMGIISHLTPPNPSSMVLKSIHWLFQENPLFSKQYLTMIEQLSKKQGLTIGTILSHTIPSPLRSPHIYIHHIKEGKASQCTLEEFIEYPEKIKEKVYQEYTCGLAKCIRIKTDAYNTYKITISPPFTKISKSKKEIAILETLWEEENLSKEELEERVGKGINKILNTLLDKEYIHVNTIEMIKKKDIVHYTNNTVRAVPSLTKEQEIIVNELFTDLNTNTFTAHLLFGITGSGKSRIYYELIQKTLKKGKHALLLVPEVSLLHKISKDIEEFFLETPYIVYHGYHNPLYKENIFLQTLDKATIIIGTRSALFLPIENIGIVIMDEEHDSSYKQDSNSFMYHAKDVAWYKAKEENALLLLGSATPDIKTYYASETHQIKIHRLNNRATGIALPKITFIEMKDIKHSFIAPQVLEEIQKRIAKNEQVIMMLNRRGYAPSIYCISCSTVLQCPHCEISMTFHKKIQKIQCHYCGYSQFFPQPCPQCKGLEYYPLGQGTEKLQETLLEILPEGISILRLDKDTGKTPERIHTILQEFSEKKADILVGTQMLAKGHDFHNVTLTVIIDADVGLHFPDYRASEKTFQLLVQSAGRSGRGGKQGSVLVQTVDSNHYAWQFIQNNNYHGFYEQELQLRKERHYPPFIKLALIRFTFPVSYRLHKKDMKEFTQILQSKQKEYTVVLLGPTAAPLEIMYNRRRFQCLVKAHSWDAIRSFYAHIVNSPINTHFVRLSLDMDPVTML
ncbi:MAG: replication restart helicase PriA [Desulfovibrionaceae bacterium]